MGKHKPTYKSYVDQGDYVVVTNAKHVSFTGQKWEKKLYRWHTGYPGGLKEIAAGKLKEKFPERILFKAVAGMLPKNLLKKKKLTRLRIFNDEEHTHHSQLASSHPIPPSITIPAPATNRVQHEYEFHLTETDEEYSLAAYRTEYGKKLDAQESAKKAAKKKKKKTWDDMKVIYENKVGP